MFNAKYLRVLWITACASSGLLACSADVSSPNLLGGEQAGAAEQKSPWVQSPQKHNNAGIQMRYRVDGRLAVGQPVTVWLEFTGAKNNNAHVNVNPAKSLRVSANGGMQKRGEAYQLMLIADEMTSRAITVTPSSEGEHFISVQLTQNGQSSAAGIMLRVGQKSAAAETIGQRVTTESGEKLIVMPAK